MPEVDSEAVKHSEWVDRTSRRLTGQDPKFTRRVAFWQGLFADMQSQLDQDRFIEVLARSKAISEYEATTEPLTGLTNLRGLKTTARNLFAEARDSSQPLAIGVIDLINLRRLNNEVLGHAGADQLLAEMAKIFAKWRMPGDVFARLHGDEFACLASDTNEKELQKVLQAIEIEVGELFVKKRLDKLSFPTGISYGVVEWNGKDNLNRSLKKADQLMYKHKTAVKAGNHG